MGKVGGGLPRSDGGDYSRPRPPRPQPWRPGQRPEPLPPPGTFLLARTVVARATAAAAARRTAAAAAAAAAVPESAGLPVGLGEALAGDAWVDRSERDALLGELAVLLDGPYGRRDLLVPGGDQHLAVLHGHHVAVVRLPEAGLRDRVPADPRPEVAHHVHHLLLQGIPHRAEGLEQRDCLHEDLKAILRGSLLIHH